MLLKYISGLLAIGFIDVVVALANTPFHTSDRWILDSTNSRYKFRCVNWPGHLEVNIPEGLASQTPESIAVWIKRNNFNCVRMTYSIEMALDQNVPVKESFQKASGAAHDAGALMKVYDAAVTINPWIANSTRIGAFAKVIQALDAQEIAVVLDNHVSVRIELGQELGWAFSMTKS